MALQAAQEGADETPAGYEKLLAERAVQQGSGFTLKQFHDSYLAAGRIPFLLFAGR